MKNKLQFKDLRHKLSWLLCLVAFLAIAQGAWADNEYGQRYFYVDCTSFTSYPSVNCSFFWQVNCVEEAGYHLSLPTCEDNVYYKDLSEVSASYTYLRSFQVSQGSGWWNKSCHNPAQSGNKQNCVKITDWGVGSWSSYALTPSTVKLSVTAGASGGAGTQSDPYIVEAGGNFTLTASGVTYSPNDPNMRTVYGFGTSPSSEPTGIDSYSTMKASSTPNVTTQYYVSVRGFYNSSYSKSYKSTSVYVRTQSSCPTPTLGGIDGDDTDLEQGSQHIYTATGASAGSGATITSYNWTLPDGWSKVSASDNTVTVTVGNTAGEQTIKCSVTNSCGSTSSTVSKNVTVAYLYYVAGNGSGHTDGWCDNKSWDPAGSIMSGKGTEANPSTITFSNVAQSSDLQFKVTNGTWDGAHGYSDWDTETSELASGDIIAENEGNVKISTTGLRDITISYYHGGKIHVKTVNNCTPPEITVQPSTEAEGYCHGASATALNVTATGTAPLSYQWQKSSDGSDWSDVPGATETSYTPLTEAVGTQYYRCIVSNTCGNAESDASGAITVKPNMALESITLSPASICITATSTITPNGLELGGGIISYTSATPTVATIDGTTITAVSAGTSVITATVSEGCGSTVSKTASLEVKPDASISSVSLDRSSVCTGTQVQASADAVLGGGTGVWTSSDDKIATINNDGVITTIEAGTPTFTYTITGGCNSEPSAATDPLTINASPVISPASTTTTNFEVVNLNSTADISLWKITNKSGDDAYFISEDERSASFKGTVGNGDSKTFTIIGNANTCLGSATITVTKDVENCK